MRRCGSPPNRSSAAPTSWSIRSSIRGVKPTWPKPGRPSGYSTLPKGTIVPSAVHSAHGMIAMNGNSAANVAFSTRRRARPCCSIASHGPSLPPWK